MINIQLSMSLTLRYLELYFMGGVGLFTSIVNCPGQRDCLLKRQYIVGQISLPKKIVHRT